MGKITRFISSYRWELWLVIGIPIIASLIRINAFYFQDLLNINRDGLFSLGIVVPSFVVVVLLALSYPFVRRLGREFLTLLWGYMIVASAINLLSFGSLFTTELTLPEEGIGVVLGLAMIIILIALVVHFFVLLWFARQASRLSITHAFFFVALVSLAVGGFVQRPDPFVYWAAIATWAVGSVITLCVKLVRVWLLGNFDTQRPSFRRKAVIGLIATTAVAGYVGALAGRLLGDWEFPRLTAYPWLDEIYESASFGVAFAGDLAGLLVVFGIVWLIRVRKPCA